MIVEVERRHTEFVNFLDQQNRLGNGEPVDTKYGEMSHGAVVYDPIVVTKPFKDYPAHDGSDRPEPNIRIGTNARIDSFTKLEGGGGLWIGANVHIASFAHINVGGGQTILENGSAVASGAVIISGGNAPDAESCSAVAPEDEQVLHRLLTRIGKNACLYAKAVVAPGVQVGEGARIYPGAVVTKDVPPFEVWGGVPAKYIRRRTDDVARRYFESQVDIEGHRKP